MVRIVICVALVICLSAVTNAGRRRPKLTPEEVEFMKETVPMRWQKDLPGCPKKGQPYIVYYGHSNVVSLELTPNINDQNTSQVLMNCEEDFPSQPFAVLKNVRNTEKCDHLVVKSKSGKPFIVSRLCYKTFSVNTVEMILYKTVKKGIQKEFSRMEIEPQPGENFFREVCVEGTGKQLVSEIEFKYVVQAPTFYMRDLVIWACLPKVRKNKA